MSATKKKIKDYLNRGVRKLKHRKGFGVHSPFAYGIITEVIEEKLPYYAYRRMERIYAPQTPISFKVACLLLRLCNRFRCRHIAELCCDGGYSLLPLLLTDSRLRAVAHATPDQTLHARTLLSLVPQRIPNVTFTPSLDDIRPDAPFDMIIVNGNPYLDGIEQPTPEQREEANLRFVEWIIAHSTDDTVIFVRGIQIHHRQEAFWDSLCDRDDVSITMDLYDYGLAIRKPRFFKQHYIVSF